MGGITSILEPRPVMGGAFSAISTSKSRISKERKKCYVSESIYRFELC